MPDLAVCLTDVAQPSATTSLRVDVPTLAVWGMQDPGCWPGQLDNLHDYAPNAIVVRIEDAGHRPMQSHSMLVNRAIRDFYRIRITKMPKMIPGPVGDLYQMKGTNR